jgi:MerR family transcriptional regulator, light-induced transcriptional regulator
MGGEMDKQLSSGGAGPTYRSGTAARLAGIPVDTLRMWERRYQVVGPPVSARGHRRYEAADIDRLALLKSLVDFGHSIGAIVHLPASRLLELRAAVVKGPGSSQPRSQGSSPVRVAIVGEALATRSLAAAARFPRLQIVATGADREHAAGALRDVAADLLAIELPALRDDAVEFVDALAAAVGARQAVVSYRFGTEAAVQELRRRGHAVARAPIDLAHIESLSTTLQGPHVTTAPPRLAPPPIPRFDERTLAQLAQLPTTVRCECPHHVVDLLLSLQAFERYSAECENRNLADAELHRQLGRFAGNARAMLEEALILVAQAEGVALPSADA